MSRTLIRIATVSLALVALAAPTALARPAEMPAPAQRSADSGGFPARPVLDRNPTPPSPRAPAAVPVAPADHGVDWTTIGLGVAGGLVAVGAVAGLAVRTRRAGSARATA